MNTNKLFIQRCEAIVTSLLVKSTVDINTLTKWLGMNDSAAYQVVNKMLVYNIVSKQGKGKNAIYSLSENLARRLKNHSSLSFTEISKAVKQIIQDYNKPTTLMPGRKLIPVKELIAKVEAVQDLILRVKNLEAKIAQYEKNM